MSHNGLRLSKVRNYEALAEQGTLSVIRLIQQDPLELTGLFSGTLPFISLGRIHTPTRSHSVYKA